MTSGSKIRWIRLNLLHSYFFSLNLSTEINQRVFETARTNQPSHGTRRNLIKLKLVFRVKSLKLMEISFCLQCSRSRSLTFVAMWWTQNEFIDFLAHHLITGASNRNHQSSNPTFSPSLLALFGLILQKSPFFCLTQVFIYSLYLFILPYMPFLWVSCPRNSNRIRQILWAVDVLKNSVSKTDGTIQRLLVIFWY